MGYCSKRQNGAELTRSTWCQYYIQEKILAPPKSDAVGDAKCPRRQWAGASTVGDVASLEGVAKINSIYIASIMLSVERIHLDCSSHTPH